MSSVRSGGVRPPALTLRRADLEPDKDVRLANSKEARAVVKLVYHIQYESPMILNTTFFSVVVNKTE